MFSNARVQFNQGLDIRLIDRRNAYYLSQTKYLGEYIFAFDDIRQERSVERGLATFKEFVPKDWKTKFFVYCNANNDIEEVIYRIKWCREHKVLPYLMRDKNCWSSENREFYTDLAAYCNQPNIFKKMNPSEYIEKRQEGKADRIEKFISLYNRT